MTTDRHHTRLDAYLDGGLPATAAAAVEAHLRDCPACRAESEATADVDSLASSTALALPPEFAAAVRARAVGRRAPLAPLWWLSLPPSWRLGLASLFVLAALGGLRLGREVAAPPATAEVLAATLQSPEVVAMHAVRPAVAPVERMQP